MWWSPGIICQVVHACTCNALISLLTCDFCFHSCTLISGAKWGNVAQCNPIGIDFNQDNVPACLIMLSERHKMAKDHLLNVTEACLEENVQNAHTNWSLKSLLYVCLYSRFKRPNAHNKKNHHKLIVLVS